MALLALMLMLTAIKKHLGIGHVKQAGSLQAKSEKTQPQRQDNYEFYHLLTAPSVQAKAPEAKVAEDVSSSVYLQLGSFQHSAEASQLAQQFKDKKYAVHVEKVYLGETVWYRVRLGPFDRMIDIKKAKDDALTLGLSAQERL